MPYRDNREYRTMVSFDVVPSEEENYIVEGYASTFDTYTLFEQEGVAYNERIAPEAYEDCNMSDVVFLKDHTGTVFARTKNNTVQLEVDGHGLKVRADLSKTSSAKAMYEEIKAGMYDQMSFAFVVDDEEYDQRSHTRTIKHIKKLFDVSAVTFPANGFTDISVATRSIFDGFIENEKVELLNREKEQKLALAKAKFDFLKEN